MIVPVSDPQLVFRPLLIAGKILPLRASKSISRGQGRRNGSEPGAQAESLQCISARIVSVPCIAGGLFPGTAPAAPRGGGPCVANGRLRHMLIGYARVSKTDGSQSLDLQRDALRAAGVDDAVNLYHDFASGLRDDRPGLDSCLRALRKDDVLVVWKLDRLGRNLAHLVNTVQDLSARGVGPAGARGSSGGADRHHDRGRPPRVLHLRGPSSSGELIMDPAKRRLTGRALERRVVLAMIKRRAAGAGLPPSTCCHTFRATGITAYLSNGGTLEHAQQIAGHASPKTTKLYDRTADTVTVDEIERIVI